MTEDPGGVVTYRVKDILAEINGKLDRVMDKLDAKAERADVHDIKTRVTALELRARLEDDRDKQSETAFTRREKILALLIAILAVAVDPLLHLGRLP
jgi:hypothetical protein